MKLFLVRHGESTWNAQGRYQGRKDPPLSPRGRAQAESLASRLAEQRSSDTAKVAAIVSSPLARARETAQICADVLGLEVDVREQLTEISHGDWEGKSAGDVARAWPEMLNAWRTTPDLVRFPGGESLAQVSRRFESFLSELRATEGPLLAITHDVIVRLALLFAVGRPLSAFNEAHAHNAAINEFDLQWLGQAPGRFPKLTLVRFDDTAHLGPLSSDPLGQAL